MKLFIASFVAFGLLSTSEPLFSQTSTVLLQGRILSDYDNQPVTANIEFTDADGGHPNRTTFKQNSDFFQVVLKSGKKYAVKINGNTIIAATTTVEVPATTVAGKEMKQDFIAKAAYPGRPLFREVAFAFESAVLLPNMESTLMNLLRVMNENRHLRINIALPVENPIKTTSKSKKRGKKSPPPPVESVEVQQSLTDRRIEAVQTLLKDVKSKDRRIVFVPTGTISRSVAPKKSSKKTKNKKDESAVEQQPVGVELTVTVSELLKME